MRCSAPCCKNNSDDVSTEGKGISFHSFPSDKGLRAAWLRALSKQGSLLPDSAVVCSQHFLDDDICTTESGLRQLASGAVPSTVQVCMICLDTDSRLFLMSKYKMEEAYENLTGYPPCDVGNLKQALCIQCAQRLRTFSQFKDKSLRARAIMMDLVEKHELITRQHIKMINRTKNQLDNSFVVTTLGPDPCDLHIQEHPSEEQRTDSEVTLQTVVKVEKKDSCDSISFNEDNVVEDYDSNAECVKNEFIASNEECLHIKLINRTKNQLDNSFVRTTLGPDPCDLHIQEHPSEEQRTDSEATLQTVVKVEKEESCDSIPINEDNAVVDYISNAECVKNEFFASNEVCLKETEVPLKYESALFQCTLCCEEFESEPAYEGHMGLHAQAGVDDWTPAAASSSCPAPAPRTPHRAAVRARRGARRAVRTPSRVSCSSAYANSAPTVNRPSTSANTSQYLELNSGKSNSHSILLQLLNTVAPLSVKLATNHGNKVQAEEVDTVQKSKQTFDIYNGEPDDRPIDTNDLTNINNLANCVDKLYDDFKKPKVPLQNESFVITQRAATTVSMDLNSLSQNEDLIACNISQSEINLSNMDTTERFTCDVCKKTFKQKSHLVQHIKVHSDVKPFACKFCPYRSKYERDMSTHMRTHTGEKPYLCKLCNFKCAQKSNLVVHMRTHTGEKPFFCELCNYRCVQKFSLLRHMRSHTGEKPFNCKLCDFRCAQKPGLVRHMKSHTGEKPFNCKLCDYRCAQKSYLVSHMRSHTGEKPYLCKLCDYKCAQKSSLVIHMRTHKGEKPYLCKLCDYKCAQNAGLVIHMRTHNGEKPYLCNLCDYRSVQKQQLVCHMSTHTGEKPYSCKLCDYRCARKSSLEIHMRTHNGEKPYLCKLCEYRCAHKSSFFRHMRTHTGE